jgi:hypothetical protein
MPANVGKMFYVGEVPWHGQGVRLETPADLATALAHGALDWTVSTRPIAVGGDDQVDTSLLYSNSHDGSQAVDMRIGTVRVVCRNTLNLALSEQARRALRRDRAVQQPGWPGISAPSPLSVDRTPPEEVSS